MRSYNNCNYAWWEVFFVVSVFSRGTKFKRTDYFYGGISEQSTRHVKILPNNSKLLTFSTFIHWNGLRNEDECTSSFQ